LALRLVPAHNSQRRTDNFNLAVREPNGEAVERDSLAFTARGDLKQRMANELEKSIQRLCLAFPEAERFMAHGAPNFRIRGGKTFAMYSVNHHGDGRIALWLPVPEGMQSGCVEAEPKHFFVPPYVGTRGWLGVRLDMGIAWKQVAQLVRMSYEKVAPPRLSKAIVTPKVPAPKRKVTLADIDPKNAPRGKRILASMREICLGFPETAEGLQFGQPVWRAGKKVFAQAYCYEGRWRVAFWVGVDMQGLMTTDPRYEIPPYMGHNGWIALDVSKSHRASELRSLAMTSYQHFALHRMLAQL
jgi:predicted DNA-binding protein (MmcQ/YjbR family)